MSGFNHFSTYLKKRKELFFIKGNKNTVIQWKIYIGKVYVTDNETMFRGLSCPSPPNIIISGLNKQYSVKCHHFCFQALDMCFGYIFMFFILATKWNSSTDIQIDIHIYTYTFICFQMYWIRLIQTGKLWVLVPL